MQFSVAAIGSYVLRWRSLHLDDRWDMWSLGISSSPGLRCGQVLVSVAAAIVCGGVGVAHAEPGVTLHSADGRGLSFEQSSEPAPEGQSTTVTVRAPDGRTVQAIATPYKGWFDTAAVELSDLDLDGREELLIETDGRAVDHRWAVWRATGDSPRFAPAGVVSGHPENVGPGLLKVRAAQAESFYTFERGVLTPVNAPPSANNPPEAPSVGER